MKNKFSGKELYEFIDKAGKATYAGGGKREEKPERPGFTELVFSEADFSYRDSYTGFYRSRGMEVVRYRDKPVWAALYGGGMVKGNESLAEETFKFLKKAMLVDEKGFKSFRGPYKLEDGNWKYAYSQKGGVDEFSGSEEIYCKSKLVFFHRIIGGRIDTR